jgi:hypothetical protein
MDISEKVSKTLVRTALANAGLLQVLAQRPLALCKLFFVRVLIVLGILYC